MRTHRSAPAQPIDGQEGFTIVELMVAISIFAIVVSGVAIVMAGSLNLTRNNRNRAVAANLAAQEMDAVRSTEFVDLPLGQIETTQSIDGVPYVIRRESEWVDQNATTGPCQAPPGSPVAYLRVTVSVFWNNMTGVKPATSQTVLAPPVGVYDDENGHIAVSVIDRAGAPNDGIDITITSGSGAASQTSTTDGCAFFPYLESGTYTVLAAASGHVDGQNDPAPVQTATVAAGSTSAIQFQMDEATTLRVNHQGASGYQPPADVAISVANAHIVPAGVATYPGSGSPRDIDQLFPWTDGYTAFAGSCADANPVGTDPGGVPFYPDAAPPDPVEAIPGGISTFDLLLPEVEVDAGGAGVAVTAVHAPDDLCPSGITHALGTSGGGGWVNSALPLGTWDIYVGGSYRATVTLEPDDVGLPEVVS